MAIAGSALLPCATPSKTAAHANAAASVHLCNRAEKTHGRTTVAFTVAGSIRSTRAKFIIMEERDPLGAVDAQASLETRGELGY
jgi:hypothetical protein